MDLEDVRKRFENIGGTEEEFRQLVAEAEKAVTNDLQSPAVREEIWAEAKRFQRVAILLLVKTRTSTDSG
jgi:hypothetical protein